MIQGAERTISSSPFLSKNSTQTSRNPPNLLAIKERMIDGVKIDEP